MHNCIEKLPLQMHFLKSLKKKKEDALAQTWGGDAQKDIKSEEAGLWIKGEVQ